jgi:hypothetical protein
MTTYPVHTSLFAIAASVFLFGATALASPPIVHHDLAVILYPASQRLTGTDTLKVTPGKASRFFLTLAADAHVTEVSIAGKTTPFTFENGCLHIPLAQHAGSGEVAVSVSYEAFFRDSVPKDPIHTEDPSYGVTGVILPEGTFLLPGAGWYPDFPGSSCSFFLRVQAPAGYEAVTQGKRLNRDTDADLTISVWDITHATKGLALSAGPYVVQEREVHGIPIYTYLFPEDRHLAGQYLEATARYLRLYSNLFGPYPFEKFAVVENFFPTGYGFPSYTLLGKTVIRLPFILDTSLGHEVAHSWWGNGVLVDYDRGNWCEGLTVYVADYSYKERSSAEEGRAYRLKVLRDYATLVPSGEDFPLQAFTGRISPLTRAVGYGKGAMVFHMARRLVDDMAFWAGLRDVFREKCFRVASWDDFAEALGHAGGRNLKPFFCQWVTRPGAPKLAVEDVELKKDNQGWEVSGRLTQKSPYYDLEVPLRLETDGASIEAKISSTGREAFFALSSNATPRRLVADPDVDLFRHLDPSEIPPSVNGIKGSKSLVVVVARSLSPVTRDASRLLLKALGQEKSPMFLEDEIYPSRLEGHDVLYVGFPKDKAYLPTLPKGLAVWPDRFTVEGVRYHGEGDVLFVVLPNPQDRQRVMGLFLPLSANAVPKVARKIPHYGKYSYLVFRKGVNQAKGTWPVSASPLIHVFSP